MPSPSKRTRARQDGPSSRLLSVALRDIEVVARANRIIVARAANERPPEPDIVLAFFGSFFAASTRTAWLRLRTYDPLDTITGAWLAAQNRRLGHNTVQLKAGYYLFVNGEVRGYASDQIDGDPFAVGASAVGMVAALLSRDPALGQGVFAVVQARTAARVIAAFLPIVAPGVASLFGSTDTSARAARATKAHGSVPRQPASSTDSVAIAFQTLGVEPTATHELVKSRYRALAKRWHPDRFSGQANAYEAEVRMTQLNLAYATVCTARGWS